MVFLMAAVVKSKSNFGERFEIDSRSLSMSMAPSLSSNCDPTDQGHFLTVKKISEMKQSVNWLLDCGMQEILHVNIFNCNFPILCQKLHSVSDNVLRE